MKNKIQFTLQFLDKTLISKDIKHLNDNECSMGLFSKRHMSNEREINKYMYENLLSEKPFLVGRFGGFELNMMVATEFNRKK